jgi:hypothetical protein
LMFVENKFKKKQNTYCHSDWSEAEQRNPFCMKTYQYFVYIMASESGIKSELVCDRFRDV